MCGTPKGQSPELTGLTSVLKKEQMSVPEALLIPDPTLVYVEGTAVWKRPQLPEYRSHRQPEYRVFIQGCDCGH